MHSYEIATKKDIHDHTKGFATKEEVEELRGTMTRILDIIDPPSDEEKQKKLSNGGYDNHLKLIRQKSSEI